MNEKTKVLIVLCFFLLLVMVTGTYIIYSLTHDRVSIPKQGCYLVDKGYYTSVDCDLVQRAIVENLRANAEECEFQYGCVINHE